MNKLKVNGILLRMQRIRKEIYQLAAEFGDVDNYFATELETLSDNMDRLVGEIHEWKKDWRGAI